jgi:tRNA-specific 2-thiouridylase
MARIVVGMSGGVDSSLSAHLLREQGHEVVGVTMKLWPCAEEDGGFTREDACCSPTETIDARAAARSAGLRHYVLDLEQEFAATVVQDFVDGWARGETPNPCVRCNEQVKFGHLWQHAQKLGAERVATGHYARVERVFDRFAPAVSADPDKDQTYFLFSLTQEQLAAAEFPVGGLTKEQVREAARARRLAVADKHESQDICFVGTSAADFLRSRIPESFRPGPVLHVDGRTIGEHRGLPTVTIGQRRGLGVPWPEPLFVIAIDPARNAVIAGPRSALLTDRLILRDCTWHLQPPPFDALVRTRHRGRPVPARILPRDGGAEVVFAEPQPRTGAGQACVVYDQPMRLCLGGGWIA